MVVNSTMTSINGVGAVCFVPQVCIYLEAQVQDYIIGTSLKKYIVLRNPPRSPMVVMWLSCSPYSIQEEVGETG